MSRHALTSIYETAIASRPQTLQLLNEITNSPKNIERFKEVYCPWFPFGDVGQSGWGWAWPMGPGVHANPDRVKNYNDLFKSQKYPDPTKIQTNHNGVNVSHNFSNVITYSLQIPLLRQGDVWKHQYELMLTDLVEKAKAANIGAEFLHKEVSSKIERNSIWRLDLQYATPRKRDLYSVRYLLDEYIIHFIIIYFMNVQKTLPQRDIFKYGSVLDLLQALTSAVSNRQKKSTKGAIVKKEIPGLIYENDNVLVVEPPTWQFSRRYFGAPQRHSLVTSGKVVDGANWCTSASDQGKWQDLIVRDRTNLYYFVRKSDETLYAIRTAGGDTDAGKRSAVRLLHNGAWGIAHLNNILSGPDYAKTLSQLEDVRAYAKQVRDLKGNIATVTNEEGLVDDLLQLSKELKEKNYIAYTEFFTLEARDQQNKLIAPNEIFNTFSLDLDWIKSNLKYVDLLDQ